MPGRADARRFTKRARSFCTVAQDRDGRARRRSKPMQHAAQLVPLPISLRRHTAEHDLFPIVIADLGKHHLKRANLITANRAHVPAGAAGWLDAACCSNRAPTRRVRRRVVSTAGTSSSGRDSDNSVLARAYGSKDPIFAMTRSYSGVHRSGMISATGVSVCRLVTAHWQRKKRGARTSTVPNRGNSRRVRTSLSGRCDPQCEQPRRWRQYSSACARTRWSCNPVSVRFPSASIRPTVPAEHSLALLPPALTSCNRTTPSLPVNSTMTRHFIPPPGRPLSARPIPPPALGRSRSKFWNQCGTRE